MNTPEKIAAVQRVFRIKNIRKGIIIKAIALSIPALVMIVGLFLPLRDVVRQALVGVILIWIYTGAMIGFSFLE